MPDLSTFNENPLRLVSAFVLAATVAMVVYRIHALTKGGAVAATLVGGSIVGGAGWWCGCLLVVFFATSTLLTQYRTSSATFVRQQRGDARDAMQVLANGGVPALLGLIAGITGGDALLVGAVVAIAVATADTWATEVGRLTRATPRSISTGKRVPVGTSGAISVPGTLATIVGSGLIAMAGAVGFAIGWIEGDRSPTAMLTLIAIAGIVGSLLDSLIGATIQESFFCPTCNTTTESAEHAADHGAIRVGGLPGFNNDAVNISSIVVTALVATVSVSILNQAGFQLIL